MLELTDTQRRIAAIPDAGTRFPVAAYEFVADTVQEALAKLEAPRHISARELLTVFRDFAEASFGPMTPSVLEEWNIHRASDVGTIVYQLIEIKLLSASPEDRIEDFAIEFDLVKQSEVPEAGADKKMKRGKKVPKID